MLYNQNKSREHCIKCMYIVYCLTFDKLYIQQDVKDNFKRFLDFRQNGLEQIKIRDKTFLKVNLRDYQQFF